MIIPRLLLTFVFAVNMHFIHAQMNEYIDADNFHAAQNITYGFKPWYEHENALPAGVVTISPSGDATGEKDRNNIQQAIESMHDAGGGKIQLEPGKYYVNNVLAIRSNVIIRGAGRDSTIIRNTRTAGDQISWNAMMPGIHHPAFHTRDKEDDYQKIKIASTTAGTDTFIVLDGTFDGPVFTNQNNRAKWDNDKPEVGDLVMICDYDHGRDGQSAENWPKAVTHHWTQYAKITEINGYKVTIDEPHVHDRDEGVVFWIPEKPPFASRANLDLFWTDNCVIGDMTFENTPGLIYGYVGVRNMLFENINTVNIRGSKKGFQIQGLYKSTIRNCYTEVEGGRCFEIKHGSARSLLEDCKFDVVGATSWRPAISTGESVYAIHFNNNEWHYHVDPHPTTYMFMRSETYGGSFTNNYIHGEQGVSFPSGASMFSISSNAGTLNHENSEFDYFPYFYHRVTGYTLWKDNRIDIDVGIGYDIRTGDNTGRYWTKGIKISGDDWTGTTFTRESYASRLLNVSADKEKEVVIAENVRNMKGRTSSWSTSNEGYPRTFANINDPDQVNSIITNVTIHSNDKINNSVVKTDGMVAKSGDNIYRWNESASEWEIVVPDEYLCTIVKPEDSTTFKADDSISFEINAYHPEGIKAAMIKLDTTGNGHYLDLKTDSDGEPYEMKVLNKQYLNVGEHHIIPALITMNDEMIIPDNEEIKLFIEPVDTIISITWPFSGKEYTQGEEIIFKMNASHPDGVEWAAINYDTTGEGDYVQLAADSTPPFQLDVSEHGLIDTGNYKIRPSIKTGSGETIWAHKHETVMIHVMEPDTTIAIASPMNGASFNHEENIEFNLQASHPDGIKALHLKVDTSGDGDYIIAGTDTNGRPWIISFSPREYIDTGTFRFKPLLITNNDDTIQAGEDEIIWLNIEKTEQVIKIISPADSAVFTIGEQIIFDMEATHPDGVWNVALKYYTGNPSEPYLQLDADFSPPYEMDVTSNELMEVGTHTIRPAIRTLEEVFIWGDESDMVTITIKGKAPDTILTIVSPEDGDTFFLNETIHFELEAFHPDGIKLVGLKVDTTGNGTFVDLAVDDQAPYEMDIIDSSILKVGKVYIKPYMVTDKDEVIMGRNSEVIDLQIVAEDDTSSLPIGIFMNSSQFSEEYFYPNPAKSIIHFNIKSQKQLNVEIMTIHGKTVMNKSIRSPNLDISHLTNGLYVVKISGGQDTIIKKLIVDHE